MKIGIANDHAGYELKLKLVDFFKQKGIDYKDFGADTSESVDYPEFGHKLAIAVEQKCDGVEVVFFFFIAAK